MKTHHELHQPWLKFGALLLPRFHCLSACLFSCLFCCLFACLLAFSLPLLAQDAREGRDDARSTLRIGMAADITSVDPHL